MIMCKTCGRIQNKNVINLLGQQFCKKCGDNLNGIKEVELL
jgi:rRNA maturation endonuclease Nob1